MQRERSQVANRILALAGLCEKLEARRRGRQRSRTQKAIMIGGKRRHSRHKAMRNRVEGGMR
jgi:hypothetical protein